MPHHDIMPAPVPAEDPELKERNDRIVQMALEGMTSGAIAKELGVSHRVVVRVRTVRGVGAAPSKLNGERNKNIIADKESGMTKGDLVKKYGIGAGRITTILKRGY